MFTQKIIQELLLHYSLDQQSSLALMLQSFNEMSERLDRMEALLEKRRQTEAHEFKQIKRAMLSKVAAQLNHLERTQLVSIADLTIELDEVRQSLDSLKSKFIGFK